MITTEDLQRIYVQVALGTPKARCPFPLTGEMADVWDQLEIEVAAIPGTLDFPDMEAPEARRTVVVAREV